MPIRRVILVYLAVFGVACMTAVLRLQAVDVSSAPSAAWLPFVYPLLGAVSEMTLLLGVPSSVLCGLATGLSWRTGLACACALLALGFGLSGFAESASRAPGVLAQELVDAGREQCLKSPSHRSDVPIVPVAWRCPSSKRTTLVGRGSWSSKIELEAGTLELAEDLREAKLSRVDAKLKARAPLPALHLKVSKVRVRGLPPWGRPANLSFAFRLALATCAVTLTLGVGAFALRRERVPRLAVIACAFLSGAVVLGLELWLDRRLSSAASYVGAVFAGPALCAIVLVIFERCAPRRSFVAQGRS
ncbi:MAG TPA: hypothetical protein VFQ61_25195 [Polyangiaceae bacterium]|nr:hypothetical protein [Polyangiaceae bacterium]